MNDKKQLRNDELEKVSGGQQKIISVDDKNGLNDKNKMKAFAQIDVEGYTIDRNFK